MTRLYSCVTFSLFVTTLFFILIAPSAYAGLCVEKCYIFDNPLTSGDLSGLIQAVIDQIFPFAITLVALAIIYIGFRMTVAAGSGNAAHLTQWRKYLVYAIIGAAIVAGSKTIVGAISKFVQEIK